MFIFTINNIYQKKSKKTKFCNRITRPVKLRSQYLLKLEKVADIILLELFIRVVDAQLFQPVLMKTFKPIHIKEAC